MEEKNDLYAPHFVSSFVATYHFEHFFVHFEQFFVHLHNFLFIVTTAIYLSAAPVAATAASKIRSSSKAKMRKPAALPSAPNIRFLFICC